MTTTRTTITLPTPTRDELGIDGLASDDPRAGFLRAAAAVSAVLATVESADLDRPTPCADWTILDLARHVVAIMRRVAVLGEGGAWDDVGESADDVGPDDLAAAFDRAVARARTAWADDALLERPLVLPFATLPGAAAMGIYSAEFLIHGWDLAQGAGVEADWPEDLSAGALAVVTFGIPAEPRDAEMPFDPVQPTAPDAPAIERLVAWVGRRV